MGSSIRVSSECSDGGQRTAESLRFDRTYGPAGFGVPGVGVLYKGLGRWELRWWRRCCKYYGRSYSTGNEVEGGILVSIFLTHRRGGTPVRCTRCPSPALALLADDSWGRCRELEHPHTGSTGVALCIHLRLAQRTRLYRFHYLFLGQQQGTTRPLRAARWVVAKDGIGLVGVYKPDTCLPDLASGYPLQVYYILCVCSL